MGKDTAFKKNSKDWDHYFRGKTNSQETLEKVTLVGDTETTLRDSAEQNTILPHDYKRIKGMPIKSKDSNTWSTYSKLNIVLPAVRSQLAQDVFVSKAQSMLLRIIKTC